MRSRNIKPGFFKNEYLAELPPETRLLFIGLWCLADREGRLEDRPMRIKAELFAYDIFNVDSMLNDLCLKGFLLRYEVDLNKYLMITNFVKHQDPHYKEKLSEIPPPEGHEDQIKATNISRTQREKILNRDDYTCKNCGSKKHLCIDHIIPVSRGGDSSDDNLQVLCISCNTKKGNKLSGEEHAGKRNKSGRSQDFSPNSIQGRIELGLKKASVDPLIPDSLIPDSLIPDSLIPDSLIPEDMGEKPPNPDTTKRKKDNFIIPTIEEIKAHCIERNNNVDPERFFNFYESKGWMVGKNKMKNWKSCVITWEKGEGKKTGSITGSYRTDQNIMAAQEFINGR